MQSRAPDNMSRDRPARRARLSCDGWSVEKASLALCPLCARIEAQREHGGQVSTWAGRLKSVSLCATGHVASMGANDDVCAGFWLLLGVAACAPPGPTPTSSSLPTDRSLAPEQHAWCSVHGHWYSLSAPLLLPDGFGASSSDPATWVEWMEGDAAAATDACRQAYAEYQAAQQGNG